MKISANQLAPQLKKSLLPCYLVSGDEPLLVGEALDAIRAAAREQGFGSRELFVHSAGFDWSEFSGCGDNLSLFAERRIIELRLPTGKPGIKGSAAIAEFAADVADDVMLLVSAPKLDSKARNAKWVKALESRGGLVQVWPVDLEDLPGWISQRMRQAGMQPDRDAVRLIADRVEGNLLAAQQEVEKLRLLHGEGPISADEVDQAVADSSRYDVYKLVDAAVSGDAPRALRVPRRRTFRGNRAGHRHVGTDPRTEAPCRTVGRGRARHGPRRQHENGTDLAESPGNVSQLYRQAHGRKFSPAAEIGAPGRCGSQGTAASRSMAARRADHP